MMREIEIELHEASANNDIFALEILLKNKDININLENVLGLTPLMHAAKFGYAKIVEMFIKAGADVNKADKLFITPLMSAAANGHYDVVKLLIENNADVNKKDVNNTTALHYASSSNHTDIIKLLVENKADINAKTDVHITPIMYSCQLSNYEAVKFLVDNGAKLDECDIYEENVLHYAISSGNIDIVEYILNKQKLEIPRYALTTASISGNLSLVHYIHSKLKDDRKENIFSSAFISAAHNGHLDIVRYFFDTSKKDAPKAIALASSGGHKNVVEYLLMNGISPNGISDEGKSALIYAIETSNKDIIELLIKYNVDINMPDDDDITPLMYAASVGDIEIVKNLLDNNANVKLVDNLGRNALAHATMSGNITIIELLLYNGLSLKNKKENISLLMWAVIYDNLKSLKYLIQKGMDIKEKRKIYSLKREDLTGILTKKFMFSRKGAFIGILFSLSIGSVIFLGATYVTENTRINNDLAFAADDGLGSDMQVYETSDQLSDVIPEQAVEQIREIEGLKSVLPVGYMMGEIALDDGMLKWPAYFAETADEEGFDPDPVIMEKYNGKIVQTGEDDYRLKVNIYGYEDEMLKALDEYLLEGEIDPEQMRTQNTEEIYRNGYGDRSRERRSALRSVFSDEWR